MNDSKSIMKCTLKKCVYTKTALLLQSFPGNAEHIGLPNLSITTSNNNKKKKICEKLFFCATKMASKLLLCLYSLCLYDFLQKKMQAISKDKHTTISKQHISKIHTK